MSAGSLVTATGFWLGALLPVLYVPVILTGLDSRGSVSVFLVLFALHVVALVVGHEHRRDE